MRYILTSADSYFINEMTNAFGAPEVIVTEDHISVSAKIRFSFHQCYAGDYGHHQNYEACDDETMRAMASCQVHYYRMADRFAINREFNFRANSYYKHLGTWLHLLRGIDCVIFSNVPHEGYDWVLYNAAKHLGIKTYMFYIMPMRPGLPVIKYLLTDALSHAKTACEHGLKDYPEQMVEDFLLGYGKALQGKSYTPYTGAIPLGNVIASKVKGTSLRTISQKIGKALSRSFYKMFRYVENDSYSTIKTQRNRYWQKAIPLDQFKTILYFPLHYQPECTSSPLGQHFVEQDLLVKLIASVMPDDCCILVKDHPRPSLKLRYPQFFEDIKAQKNVFLVDVKKNPRDLYDVVDGVIGLTGTSLWEALFMKKPVLMAGSILYEGAPNVLAVQSAKEAKIAIDSLSNMQIRDEDVLTYLHSLKPVLFPGVISPKDEGAYSPVSPEDSARYSLSALRHNLQKDGLIKS